MTKERPFVLSIAGYDPCGGAGILADIKTFEQHDVQGLGIITANTLQVENRVFSVKWLPIEEILEQINTLMNFYPIEIVKIGIIPNVSYLDSIISAIKNIRIDTKIIWDTVLKSSSGTSFFEAKDIIALKKILPQINLITPNAIEYEILRNIGLLDKPLPCPILLKGGHRTDGIGIDILYIENEKIIIQNEAKELQPKHGSGCVFSSAIAAQWAKEKDLISSCKEAKKYIEKHLQSSKTLLGKHKF